MTTSLQRKKKTSTRNCDRRISTSFSNNFTVPNWTIIRICSIGCHHWKTGSITTWHVSWMENNAHVQTQLLLSDQSVEFFHWVWGECEWTRFFRLVRYHWEYRKSEEEHVCRRCTVHRLFTTRMQSLGSSGGQNGRQNILQTTQSRFEASSQQKKTEMSSNQNHALIKKTNCPTFLDIFEDEDEDLAVQLQLLTMIVTWFMFWLWWRN